MLAVTRTIRGARRTGRGFGCSHPKCRCGFYRAPLGAPPPVIFSEAKGSCSGLAKLGRKKRVARMRMLVPSPTPARGGSASVASRGGVRRRRVQVETDEMVSRPGPPPDCAPRNRPPPFRDCCKTSLWRGFALQRACESPLGPWLRGLFEDLRLRLMRWTDSEPTWSAPACAAG